MFYHYQRSVIGTFIWRMIYWNNCLMNFLPSIMISVLPFSEVIRLIIQCNHTTHYKWAGHIKISFFLMLLIILSKVDERSLFASPTEHFLHRAGPWPPKIFHLMGRKPALADFKSPPLISGIFFLVWNMKYIS